MLLCGSPFATNAPAAHCSYTMTSKHTIEVTAPVVSAHRHQMYQRCLLEVEGEGEKKEKKKKAHFVIVIVMLLNIPNSVRVR